MPSRRDPFVDRGRASGSFLARSRILLICFVVGNALVASAAPCGQPVDSLADAFHEAFEALDEATDRDEDAAVETVVAKAGALLTRHGTLWYAASDDEDAIVIAPVRFASKLNALAYRLRRYVGGLELRFDPRALVNEDAGALYYDDVHRLLLSAQEVGSGEISDYLAHEIVHAQNAHALSRSIDNLFMGWISGGEAAPAFHESYGRRFSIDELQAYVQQARANVRELNRVGAAGDIEGTLDMLDSGLALAKATARVARQAAAVVAEIMPADARRRRIDEWRTIEGRRVRVVGYRRHATSVYFFDGWLPRRLDSPPALTRAVVEFNDLALDLTIPTAFVPASADQSVAMLLRRTRVLADRASSIEDKLEKLRASVRDNRLAQSLQLANELRRDIRPEVRR